MFTAVTGERARTALAGTRFGDVRWVAETGSTNADLLALAADGAPEGIVLVADHQHAGRGRFQRSWTAPPGTALLVSVLLRPPARVAGAVSMAAGVAMAGAAAAVAGDDGAVRLKWPNDLVHPGRDGEPDRKLAGLLAEADWPAQANIAAGWQQPAPTDRIVVVIGVGVNVNWPSPLPAELAALGGTAISLDAVAGHPIDREELLIGYLARLDAAYSPLVTSGDPAAVREEWRARTATLGRRVRVDLGSVELEGQAVDIDDDGRLVLEDDDGHRRVVAAGDVVHLRAP
jgi:BirA family biotin operon repressor/biotin-[acetyl-CoA-carboxylase] ligase